MLKQINDKLKSLEIFLTRAVNKKLCDKRILTSVNISLDTTGGCLKGYVFLHIYTQAEYIDMYRIKLHKSMSHVDIRRELLRELDTHLEDIKESIEEFK